MLLDVAKRTLVAVCFADGLALFRGFLRTEFSDENIEFWIACEEYKALVGVKKQQIKAQKIYQEFVAVQAPREVHFLFLN